MRLGFRSISVPSFGRDVWLLTVGSAIATGTVLGMQNLIRILYVLRLGFGPEFVGLLGAAGSLSFSISSLPGGALGGRFGPRRMILVGACINMAGLALMALTETVPSAWQNFWPLFAQVFASSGWSMVVVNLTPALMAFTTPENRRSAFALREALAGAGMFLGAFVGGLLPGMFANILGITTDYPLPYRLTIWVTAGLYSLAFIPFVLVKPVRGIVPRRTERTGRPPVGLLVLILICGFFNNGAMSSAKSFASAYMDREFGLATMLIGTITSVGMLLGILGALSGPRLARRGSCQAMWLSAGVLAFSLLAMAVFPFPWAAAIGTIMVQVLSAVFGPAYQVTQMEMVDPSWRSLISGAAAMAMSLGFGVVSFGGGYVVAAMGYRRLFMLGALLAVVSVAVSRLLQARLAHRQVACSVAEQVESTLN